MQVYDMAMNQFSFQNIYVSLNDCHFLLLGRKGAATFVTIELVKYNHTLYVSQVTEKCD